MALPVEEIIISTQPLRLIIRVSAHPVQQWLLERVARAQRNATLAGWQCQIRSAQL